MFDTDKFYLGTLCFKNHVWEQTKKSLRYIKCNKCFFCQKEYDDNRKEQKKKYKKEYCLRPDIILRNKEYDRIYSQRPEVKLRKNLRYNKVYKNNLGFRISKCISERIKKNLLSGKQYNSWKSLVSFTLEDLLNKFQKTQPELFQRYLLKDSLVEIDHIIPISWFVFSTYEDLEFNLCWNLKNLQLLEKVYNRSKSSCYASYSNNILCSFEDFEEQLKTLSLSQICENIWNSCS